MTGQEKQCPRCGMVLTASSNALRCPRCRQLLLGSGCRGDCSHCGSGVRACVLK